MSYHLVYFLDFLRTSVVFLYYSTDAYKTFICVFAVAILNLKVKWRSFLSKTMTDKFINSKSCRKRNLCVNIQQPYRKDVVLNDIFYFAYLKVKDTLRLWKKKRGKILHSNVEQSSMIHISAQAKYTHDHANPLYHVIHHLKGWEQ